MAAPAGAAGVSGEPGVAVVTELARRFAAGDGAGAAALFHPEIRIQQPQTLPHGGWHRGPEGMAAMGAEFGRRWTRRIGEPRILGCGAMGTYRGEIGHSLQLCQVHHAATGAYCSHG